MLSEKKKQVAWDKFREFVEVWTRMQRDGLYAALEAVLALERQQPEPEPQGEALITRFLDAMYAAGIAAPDTFAPYDASQIAGAERFLEVAREHIEQEARTAKEQLAALDWRPITAEDLPKMGDEVRRPHNSKAVQKHNNPEILAVTESMITLFSWQDDHAELWHEQSWMHFRPINPRAPRPA